MFLLLILSKLSAYIRYHQRLQVLYNKLNNKLIYIYTWGKFIYDLSSAISSGFMKIDTLINLSSQSYHHSFIFWCACGNFLVEIHWLRLYPRLYLYNLCSHSGNYNFTERKKWKTDNVRSRDEMAIGSILWPQEHAFISTTWNLFSNALHCKI